jgi:hypothetical protein
MSETAVLRLQKVQNRTSQGQKVQEQWTLYPNFDPVLVHIIPLKLHQTSPHETAKKQKSSPFQQNQTYDVQNTLLNTITFDTLPLLHY